MSCRFFLREKELPINIKGSKHKLTESRTYSNTLLRKTKRKNSKTIK